MYVSKTVAVCQGRSPFGCDRVRSRLDRPPKRMRWTGGAPGCSKIRRNAPVIAPYSELINAFRVDPFPRIALTVDMIATGTDIKPVEALLFMRDVKSEGYRCPDRADRHGAARDSLPEEVAAVVSISNRGVLPTGIDVVQFRADKSNRGIIRKQEHLMEFRKEFNAFLMKLVRAGARVLHLHSVTPLSTSVEIGRMLLPKMFEQVHAWEWQAPTWNRALRLK